MKEIEIAKAVAETLGDIRWVGVTLAKAFLELDKGTEGEIVARQMYKDGSYTLTKARELIPLLKKEGFTHLIPSRKKIGSAENPITKLFPAAITEQRFLAEIDRLREVRHSIDYEDERFAGHSLKDFSLKEDGLQLPINVKNAGTRFENAKQLVGLDPDDCVPIPAYKAYDAIEKEPNLIYVISIDYSLIGLIEKSLLPLFTPTEKIVWKLLNEYTGSRIKNAEDKFIYEMTQKHWDELNKIIAKSDFRVISARKAIRILQDMPKRTPGIGLRAWGTGATAEVNVHLSVSQDTKPWDEIMERITKNGLSDIVGAINRKKTEVVYDPEI